MTNAGVKIRGAENLDRHFRRASKLASALVALVWHRVARDSLSRESVRDRREKLRGLGVNRRAHE